MAASQPAPPGNPLSREPTTARAEELERVVQSLPPVAVEEFTAHVQPLLLNRCGAGTCHGSTSSTRFQLARPSWSKTVAHRFTQRNLYAALQEIDTAAPDKSPLLTVPNGPHGGLNAAVFSEREHEQFARLTTWVKKVSKHRRTPPPKRSPPRRRNCCKPASRSPSPIPSPLPPAVHRPPGPRRQRHPRAPRPP